MTRRLSAFRWIHPQTPQGGRNFLAFRPGAGGTGMLRPPRPPVTAYTSRVTGVPLTGGQAQGVIAGNGTLTVQVGPQALGTVWYPAQATLSTTTGTADASTAVVYLGARGVANLAVGQSYAAGADTVALAVPALTPGALLIVVWSGGNPGDTATVNIIGTMDALTAGMV